MPTRKRRLWLHVSGEPVCHLFALWRRERDLAQFCTTEPVGLKSSAAPISGPLRAESSATGDANEFVCQQAAERLGIQVRLELH